jgi:hypothetical protein
MDILTIRTASTTLTCQLGVTGLREWASSLNSLADQLSNGIVVVSGSDVAAVSQWPPVSRA